MSQPFITFSPTRNISCIPENALTNIWEMNHMCSGTPVVPATQDAEVGGLIDSRSSR
jgi:hypothetical protein